jgi:hypothetical protein
VSNPFETRATPEEKAATFRAANQRRQDDEFLRNALKSRAGRDFFWRFLERTHIFETSYSAGAFDMTAFREGERNLGLALLTNILRVAPEAWMQMMQERSSKIQVPEPVEEEGDENA